MTSIWIGVFYTVAGIYLLIRHNSEAEEQSRGLEESSLRVLLGGTPRPLTRSAAARLIRVLTITAGFCGVLFGLASIIAYVLRE